MSMTRLASISLAALAVGSSATAEPLDASALQTLMAKAPWHVQTGGETNYFIWSSAGGLCVKMYDPAAETCDDEGRWKLEGSKVCYELTWWGSAYDQGSACVTVEPVADEPVDFHANESNGMTVLYFSVPETR